ncbi:ABC transporter permease [Actinokineospora sp. NBRC 105648]|uniref:ABC transporter permease n=1 Tax=Actinokineospora sp. NBRC 105648 TaxID=3032206 RepID=UPI0024A38F65|nr:ABC transporter permease [Actinokineospora sp. NBRC 105648]GLZ41075.1 transport permease protein [Actinokineospora sp. NBRC 105648]
MTTRAPLAPTAGAPPRRAGAGGALVRVARESADFTWRNLIHLRRTPTTLASSLLEPILFAGLIGYVFGGSLGGPAYREYLVAGLLGQAVTFTASFTAIGIARDLQEGTVERFSALPIARVSLLLGRTTADLATCLASTTVTTGCGLVLGWRPHTGPAQVLGGYLVVLLFAFALSWIGAFIGIIAPNVQVAASLGLIWLFPVTFVSSGFIATASLPEPLATIAAWNPITALANALRALFGNAAPPGFPPQHGWATAHPVPYAVGCAVLLVIVFIPLSTWRYRVRTSR